MPPKSSKSHKSSPTAPSDIAVSLPDAPATLGSDTSTQTTSLLPSRNLTLSETLSGGPVASTESVPALESLSENDGGPAIILTSVVTGSPATSVVAASPANDASSVVTGSHATSLVAGSPANNASSVASSTTAFLTAPPTTAAATTAASARPPAPTSVVTSQNDASAVPTTKADRVLADRFRMLRDSLAGSPSYLASSNLRENVTWIKDGRRHRLVWKTDVLAADEQYKKSVADGDSPAPTNVPNATLSMVVLISDDDCWLNADAGWRGSSQFASSFANIKLTCTGAPPPYNLLQQDFVAAITNIEHIMKKSDGYGAKRFGVIVGQDGVKKIRFRHVPFIPLDKVYTAGSDDKTTENDDVTDSMVDLADWPVYSDAARKALEELKTTHAAQPLIAFDMHGALIAPSNYEQALRGAIAHVRFTLNKYSWRTGDNYKDTFVADIDMIRVITPPHPRNPRATGRKRPLHTDIYTPDFRPTTKQRVV